RVHEVVSRAGLTRVPTAPPFIRGLVDVHGTAVPVIDLSRRFSAARPESAGYESIVVVATRIRGTAVLAGVPPHPLGRPRPRLGRVRHVEEDQIQAPPPLDSLVSVEFLTGVFRSEGGFVLCVDVDRILAAEEADRVAELSRELPGRVVAPKVTRRPYLCVRLA